jgi:hypothetical protein
LVVTNPGDQTSHVGDVVALQIQGNWTDTKGFFFSATTLPSGLSLNPHTGVISGTVASTGVASVSYTVTVHVAHEGGSENVTFQWTVIDTSLSST